MTNLYRPSGAVSRSISAENVSGRKGAGGMAVFGTEQPEVTALGQRSHHQNPARELGHKWKVRPCIMIPAKSTVAIAEIDGPGVINHIWITTSVEFSRELILRMYWDNEPIPSVEVPLGDFFCNANGFEGNVNSAVIAVNPTNSLNCYFAMPFHKHARITIENLNPAKDCTNFFYTIDYHLKDIPSDVWYFHASFRRQNPLPEKTDMVIVDNVQGKGCFVGCYLAWQQNNSGWFGEGEVKMFIDGDDEYPTYCGTGTEDYFGSAWGYEKAYSALYTGVPKLTAGWPVGGRHSMYRFHIPDPIYFEQDFRATIQALGWRKDERFLPLRDDISATAYWYQSEPHTEYPPIGDRDKLEVI